MIKAAMDRFISPPRIFEYFAELKRSVCPAFGLPPSRCDQWPAVWIFRRMAKFAGGEVRNAQE
jgi:hypothetical protein